MIKKIFETIIIPSVLILPCAVRAQQFMPTENNQAIEEYLEEAPENYNMPIMYVFYNGSDCSGCTEAIDLIYDLYNQYYTPYLNIFTVDYTIDAGFDFASAYNLTQPLSVVLVKIKNGQAVGYYKIDNPQYWIADTSYFENNLSNQINNFLAM